MTYSFKTYRKSAILRGHLRMGGDNPAGERIDANSLYLERNGKPWLGVMGEYHFSRDHAGNWHEELCKIKAGGVNIVSTYMFWIYHEEIEGEFDFTGDRDIRRFVSACKKLGLDVFLRIGPWCHGECRNGGFPDWLLYKPFKLREDNDGYLKLVHIWYEKIYEQVQGLFYKDGGPIIGIQLENELVDRPGHLLTLKKLAQEIGFDVPLYTVTGWNSKYGAKIPVDEVLPVFGAYAEAPWAQRTDRLPLSGHYVFNPSRNDTAVGVDVLRDTDESGWRLPYERYPFLTCEAGTGYVALEERVVFPPIDVCGDASFIFPFNLDLQGNLLKYATAQPLTRVGNTYFFAQIEGIDARYKFADCATSGGAVIPEIIADMKDGQIFSFLYYNIRIVTIPWQQARFLRKQDETIYIGKDCDLYLADGEVKAVQEGSFAYLRWNGSEFKEHSVEKVWKNAAYCVEKIAETEGWPEEEQLRELLNRDILGKECSRWEDNGGKPENRSGDLYTGKFRDELSIGGTRRLTWYQISADSPQGFIDISEPCDTCQLYADGAFVADKYYDGEPWRFPACLVYGKDCVIVLSQMKNDCYREV